MKPKTKQNVTWRDAADGWLFMGGCYFGWIAMNIVRILFGQHHAFFSWAEFVVATIWGGGYYVILRWLKKPRFFLR